MWESSPGRLSSHQNLERLANAAMNIIVIVAGEASVPPDIIWLPSQGDA